jgi:hypothetical protein
VLTLRGATRRSITGPYEIGWRDGMRDLVETLYPGALK